MKLDRYTVLHRKDERGVIVESKVLGPDDEIPEGFGSAEYQPIYAPREDDQAPVEESKLTSWESPIAKGSWVENRPEESEVSEGTPVEARDESEMTDAEREAAGQLALDEESETEVEAPADEVDAGTPAQAREQADAVQPPPQGGPGSGKELWAQYAAAKSVSVPEDAGRDDIIAACKKAGVPVD